MVPGLAITRSAAVSNSSVGFNVDIDVYIEQDDDQQQDSHVSIAEPGNDGG